MKKIIIETAWVSFMTLIGAVFWFIYEVINPTDSVAVEQVVTRALPKANPTPEPLIYYWSEKPIELSKKDFQCLAHNIYYEAGVEDYAGKIAVAHITWNRVNNGRWGKTVCKVVYAKNQFSWTRQNKSKPKGPLWRESVRAAQEFVEGRRVVGLSKSKYYHATWINPPVWTKPMQVNAVIGQHIFYTHNR